MSPDEAGDLVVEERGPDSEPDLGVSRPRSEEIAELDTQYKHADVQT